MGSCPDAAGCIINCRDLETSVAEVPDENAAAKITVKFAVELNKKIFIVRFNVEVVFGKRPEKSAVGFKPEKPWYGQLYSKL